MAAIFHGFRAAAVWTAIFAMLYAWLFSIFWVFLGMEPGYLKIVTAAAAVIYPGIWGFETIVSPKVAARTAFGKIVGNRGAGLDWGFPGIGKWVIFDGQEITLKVPCGPFAGSDRVSVTADLVVQYQVINPTHYIMVGKIEESLKAEADAAMRTFALDKKATDLPTVRSDMDTAVKTAVDLAAARWGVKIHSVRFGEIKLPQAVQEAIDKIAVEEAQRVSETYEAETLRQIVANLKTQLNGLTDAELMDRLQVERSKIKREIKTIELALGKDSAELVKVLSGLAPALLHLITKMGGSS